MNINSSLLNVDMVTVSAKSLEGIITKAKEVDGGRTLISMQVFQIPEGYEAILVFKAVVIPYSLFDM